MAFNNFRFRWIGCVCMCLFSFNGFGQLICSEYTATGTTTAIYSTPTAFGCLVCGPSPQSGIWTGSDCTGQINVTVNGAPVESLVLAFSAVNTDDYALVTIDGGGTMSLFAENMEIDGDTIGPYNCASNFGDVYLTINSTSPFSTVNILNTGCSSGWVNICPGTYSYAGEDSTIIVCDTILNLNLLNPNGNLNGSWSEITGSGQFNSMSGHFNSTSLYGNTFLFSYNVDFCGPPDSSLITVIVSPDSVCNYYPPIDPIDTTSISPGPYNVFSPNYDGKNDSWYIDIVSSYPENQVVVYNRWGDEIRQFNNYDNTNIFWDGTSSTGSNVATGTYFFTITSNGSKIDSGWIQVVR